MYAFDPCMTLCRMRTVGFEMPEIVLLLLALILFQVIFANELQAEDLDANVEFVELRLPQQPRGERAFRR